ncbi:FkbM family methyltransferase [Pelagibacteraceae bacterium]|nr:FkbM family methyltransferase [Pelagibacteraceae bacterium]
MNIRDSLDRELFMNGYYEEKQLNILSASIDKHSINYFIDIGSNIGIYSILMSSKYSNLTIHAFEPHKDAFKRLKKNVNLNNFTNKIYLYNYALSSKNGESFLETKNRFKMSQSGGAKISKKGDIKIKYKKGDDLIKIKNQHIAIKIDTEGHELFVLKGIKNLLINNKIFLQIEIFPQNITDVIPFLTTLGFKLISKNQYTHQENILDYFFEKNFII